MLERYLARMLYKKINNDLSSTYEEDGNGNPMVQISPFFKKYFYFMFAFAVFVLGSCVFAPSYLVLDEIDPENIPAFMSFISILFLIISLRGLCYKVVLEKDTLVIRRFLKNRRISLDELRLGAMSKPPKKVRNNFIIFTTSTGKKVRVMYGFSLGGVAFVKTICNRIQAPFPQGFRSISQNASYVSPKE